MKKRKIFYVLFAFLLMLSLESNVKATTAVDVKYGSDYCNDATYNDEIKYYISKISDYNNWSFSKGDHDLTYSINLGKVDDNFHSGFWLDRSYLRIVMYSNRPDNVYIGSDVYSGWNKKKKKKYDSSDDVIISAKYVDIKSNNEYFSETNAFASSSAQDIYFIFTLADKKECSTVTFKLDENFFEKYYNKSNTVIDNPEGTSSNPKEIKFSKIGEKQEFTSTCKNGKFYFKITTPKGFGRFKVAVDDITNTSRSDIYIDGSNSTITADVITSNHVDQMTENLWGLSDKLTYYVVQCGKKISLNLVDDEKINIDGDVSDIKKWNDLYGKENINDTTKKKGDNSGSVDLTEEAYTPVCGIFKPADKGGKLLPIIKNLYKIFKIAIPLLVVILTIVEFLKVLFSGEDKTMKDAFKATTTRLILIVVLVFLPILIEFVIKIAGLSENCLQKFL